MNLQLTGGPFGSLSAGKSLEFGLQELRGVRHIAEACGVSGFIGFTHPGLSWLTV